jgi:hypothetical protein
MTTTAASKRHDPIRERYFRAVERAERASALLFYLAAVLSFAVFFVTKDAHPVIFDVTQIAFILAVGILFFVDLGIRLYWSPTGEEQRRLDFLSNAYRVALTHEQTVGYYNNDETDPLRRIAAAVLENSLFTRDIALAMLTKTRIETALYVIGLIVVGLVRSTDLAFTATVALVVFSEHVLSQWLRLEWLRMRCQQTYKALYALFQTAPPRTTLHPSALAWFAFYETSKANAGVTLSAKIFDKLNPKLSAEWDTIKATLKI